MKQIRVLLIGLSLTMSGAAEAMSIPIFDTVSAADEAPVSTGMSISRYSEMAATDEGHYLTLLLKGSVEGLEQRGNKQSADRLYDLFTKGDGSDQFFKNLKICIAIERNNASKPNQPHYTVEQVFALTLKDHNIIVPLKFLNSVNKDFKPSSSVKK